MNPPLWRRLAVAGAATTLLLAAVPSAAAQAQTTTGGADRATSYVVIMEDDPAIAYDGGVAGLAPAKPDPGEKLDPTAPEVTRYVTHLEDQHEEALAGADVSTSTLRTSYTYALNGFSAMLTAEQAARVAKQPGVVRVVRDELRQLQTDTSPTFLGLNSRRGAWASGYTGEGVVVGVIDTGVWPEHPSFADDGSYPAPPADWMGGTVACEFGDTAHNPDDAPFDCNNKLIGARDMRLAYNELIGPEVYNSARDYQGHGTHTASTAAGNRGVAAEIFGVPRGTVSGIAPRAHVAVYSVCGGQGCFSSDSAAGIDAAVADGVDVINFSIGGGAGALAADDIAFLFANDAGVFIASSAGNEGPGAGTVGSPAVNPWQLAVGANTHTRTFEGSVTLGDGSEFTGASVTNGTGELPLVDAEDHGNALCDPEVTFEPEVTGLIVLCARGGDLARLAKSQAVSEQGGAGMVLFNEFATEALITDNHYVPSVHVSLGDGQEIKAYIDAAGDGATATIGAGEKARTKGSVMADFSSRGPNRLAEDIIKPDVTAPGVNILAGTTPTPVLGAPGELFMSISGTSMASPHVAGVLALIKQAHPDWTPAMAQSAVMTTARQGVFEEDGVTRTDPFDVGAGHLDPGRYANKPNSVFNPGLVYDAGVNDYLGFLCEAAPDVFTDPAATCAALEGNGFPTTAENLNYPSIGVSDVAGVAEVQRTITNVTDKKITWWALADAPKGFKVKVSPRVVRLAPGESATVTIQFTNVRAPLDEWRFGNLTWWGGGYKVTSPIAVKGVALSSPAEVTGSGTEGTASFDLQFGYDGAYSAAAHGLVPVTGVAGSVDQDPDQEFDPGDPTGTTAHEITMAGTGHFRLALTTDDLTPANPSVDIDLYLYNSAGEQVASSTAGGTDEHIDLSLPADDTYTLYVHGWQTLGGTVDYTLRTWQVPLETGGSLSVTSAPDEAANGATGTVEVAWSGLDPAGEYLGAVSHTGPDGLLGLTLVSVTTD
jgi:subtilisin family serine protease